MLREDQKKKDQLADEKKRKSKEREQDVEGEEEVKKGRGGDKGKATFSEGADYATNSSDTSTALDKSMDMDFSVAGASRSSAHESSRSSRSVGSSVEFAAGPSDSSSSTPVSSRTVQMDKTW